MGQLSWRTGTAPSLEGPERYVIFQLTTDDGSVEVALDPDTAKKMADALFNEAHNLEMAMINQPVRTNSGLVLPPGVRVAQAPPVEAPPEEVSVACTRCGGLIQVERATYDAMKKDAGGRAFELEHEVCPDATAAHAYYIEIAVHRDPPERPTPPEATTVVAWFIAEHLADSFVEALPVLNERLIPFWEKVQANMGVLDSVADGAQS